LLFSFENVYRQYLLCRKNKRNTINALRFEVRQEKELLKLCRELSCRTYRPGRSVCFFTEKPKLREIFAADFRDRIVHHILVDYLESIYEPVFIHDSYACRKGKGIHKGVARLRTFIRRVTANGSRRAWYLQLDIKNYFMSMDKEILFSLVQRKCKDEEALWLAELLIFHDCTNNPVMRGDGRLARRIPPHKTLFHAPKGKGLPIGNLNSQFFANVYLNALDQFVKHTLKCRFYLRYCDDFVLLSDDRAQLEEWEQEIQIFLANSLALDLNSKARNLQPVSNGVNFLGYIIRGDYLLVRRRVIGNLREKLAAYDKILVSAEGEWRIYDFDREEPGNLFATFTSYLGHFKHADSFKLIKAVWQRHSFLSRYFKLDFDNIKIQRKYVVPGNFRTVRQQYGYFQKMFAGDIVFFQVGRFFEFYYGASKQVAGLLNLSPLKKNRRDARCGFPVRYLIRYLRRALDNGKSVVVVLEGKYLTKIKKREIWRRYECNSVKIG
jgi:hypothetical protein